MDFEAGVYLSEASFSPMTPYPPYTLYTSILYTYSHGGVGRVESQPERRLEGQQFKELGRKYQHDSDDILLWCL
jgi:hypothetical protein